eukprot:scaffold102765_cov14-Prasinocladus_malaysianus.AAC.1
MDYNVLWLLAAEPTRRSQQGRGRGPSVRAKRAPKQPRAQIGLSAKSALKLLAEEEQGAGSGDGDDLT